MNGLTDQLRRLTLMAAFSMLMIQPGTVAAADGVTFNPANVLRAVTGQEIKSPVRPRARDAEATSDVTVATRSAEPKTPAKLTRGGLDAMQRTAGDAQWQCLATAIYFESRGEPLEGQVAVAEVILNRVDSRSYPNTVCGVTNQGAGSGRGCQFSYACDGRSDVMKSAEPRIRSEKLARVMLDGRARTVTAGATHFHSRAVRPGWARQFTQTAAIGHHIFYRQPTRTASN